MPIDDRFSVLSRPGSTRSVTRWPHFCHGASSGSKALGDDLAFLLQRPRPPTLCPRQHLDPGTTTTRTTNRTSALYLADQVRGDRVHPEVGSRHAHRPPGVGAAPLTGRPSPMAGEGLTISALDADPTQA